MRKVLPLLAGLLSISTIFAPTSTLSAQETKFGLSLNSGLFSFAGRSATSTSSINTNGGFKGYTNNPYGSKVGWCDGLSVELRRVTRRHLLFGVSLGYEALRSRVDIASINADLYSLTAHGHTTLTSQFINFSPSVGYRFLTGKVTVDLTGGLDLGYCLSAMENGKAYAGNGQTYSSSRDRKTISVDIRPRCQVSVGFHKTAVYVGYSFGIINYMAGYVGGPNSAYSRFLRFGLQYWL